MPVSIVKYKTVVSSFITKVDVDRLPNESASGQKALPTGSPAHPYSLWPRSSRHQLHDQMPCQQLHLLLPATTPQHPVKSSLILISLIRERLVDLRECQQWLISPHGQSPRPWLLTGPVRLQYTACFQCWAHIQLGNPAYCSCWIPGRAGGPRRR